MINRRPKNHHLVFLLAMVLASYGMLGLYNGRLPVMEAAASPYSFVYDAKPGNNYEVYAYGADGQSQQLTNAPAYDSWWPKLSPDGARILFYRTPAGVHDTDYSKTSLWVMNANGSSQQQRIANGANGWQLHGHAEWSPDGTRIVMFAGSGGTLLVHTDTTGGNIQLVTTTGQAADTDPSWSPDGTTITYAYAGEIWKASRVANGSSPQRLTNDSLTDYDPYFSPDGTKIAFLTQSSGSPSPTGSWAIRVMNADGSGLHNLISDGNINSKPEWTADGSYIFFHRLVYGNSAAGFGIWYVKFDGSGLTQVSGLPAWSEYPDVRSKIILATANPTVTSTPSVTPKPSAKPTASPQPSLASGATPTVQPSIAPGGGSAVELDKAAEKKQQDTRNKNLLLLGSIAAGFILFALGLALRQRHIRRG